MPFLRQPVVHPSSIRLFHLRGDDPRRFELLQTVRQDVGGDPLARFLELLERPEPANHQIADDQQRPAIPKHLERDADRAEPVHLDCQRRARQPNRSQPCMRDPRDPTGSAAAAPAPPCDAGKNSRAAMKSRPSVPEAQWSARTPAEQPHACAGRSPLSIVLRERTPGSNTRPAASREPGVSSAYAPGIPYPRHAPGAKPPRCVRSAPPCRVDWNSAELVAVHARASTDRERPIGSGSTGICTMP